MHRTQIYLPKTQLVRLRKEALKRKATVSETIRMIIRQQFGENHIAPTEGGRETLMSAAHRINQKGSKAPRNLASQLDQYLYGNT